MSLRLFFNVFRRLLRVFQLLPEGADELYRSVSDLLQSGLNCLSEGGLTALGVFDMLIQTVLQGGADSLQPADTEPVRPDSDVSDSLS